MKKEDTNHREEQEHLYTKIACYSPHPHEHCKSLALNCCLGEAMTYIECLDVLYFLLGNGDETTWLALWLGYLDPTFQCKLLIPRLGMRATWLALCI